MPALVAGIHVLKAEQHQRRMAGTGFGHDERGSHFQAVRKRLKMLDAFSVRLSGRGPNPHGEERAFACLEPCGLGDQPVVMAVSRLDGSTVRLRLACSIS